MSYESEIVYDNTKTLDPRIKDRLKYDDKGLVCAVIQQYDTHEVLMVGTWTMRHCVEPLPLVESRSGRDRGRNTGAKETRPVMCSM